VSGTISFSGLSSGIDTSGWVDALVSIKQETVTSMQAKQEEQQKLLDVVNNIKSYFASFQSCLQKITDSQFGITSMDLFQQNLAISTNTNIATATATTEAARQSYEVAVDSLATATKATSGYSQYEVKTATLDTKFGTLGGANGTVTVNSQSFILTTDDTLGTIIQKFKDVGVDADFDEHRGIFTLGVSVSEIDDGATNLKSVLKLQDNTVSGATSGSLVYATRDTEFSKLGLNAGKVNIEGEEYVISKTGDDYTITNADGVTESMNTIGEFLDYLKNSVGAEDATIDSYGNITIKGATLDAVAGGSNIIDILNLSETTDRMVMESNPLTYIEVSAADENTKLSQLGINADTTLVIGGVEHTITNDKTLGQIKTLLKDNGNVDMSIDANGVISIETHGNEISGTLLEVLELDPTKSGATITSQTHNSTWNADGNTLLSDLGVTASDGYIAYKSDGTALNTETTGLAGKTVDEFVEMLKTAGLDASFDEATSKLIINDGYIGGAIATKLGMSNDEQTYTEAATGATTLEKLGATGNVTLTIDGGAAITYTKDMTLQDVLDDISDAGGVVEFEDGELTVQGVTLGGDIPRLLDLDATTSGTTVTSGDLSVINNNTSTGDEMTETVEYNIDLNSKIGDITGTDTTYTLSVNGGTAQNYTKDTTLSALKAQVENAGGTFAINDDNTVTIAGVELSGTLVGALGFEDTDNGTKFSSVGAITVDGASNVANEDTTLGNLELVSGTNKLTMSIDGGTAIEYGVDDSLGDIFSDIRAAGGTASIDENGYIKVDGVNLTGTVVDKLELIQNSDRTKITSGNIEVVTKTTAESTSVLTGTTNANLSWDSTLGSITGDTKSYTLSVNGAAAQTYTTGTKLSEIKTAITNAGGTMTINADNTITVDGVSLSGTVLDALKLDTTSYDTTISSNTPIYAYGGVKEATGATTFDALGIEDDKRSYAIYTNEGTLIQASSTTGSADAATINDWLAVLNTKLNTANGTTGQTYAKIENGVISITGGYITGALPTALGIGTTSEVTGVTMQGSSVTYVTSDPTEYIGNVNEGTGTAGGLVSSDGNSVDSTTQSGSASGNISNDGNLVDTETADGDAVGDASSSGDIGDATTQNGTAVGDNTNDGNLVDTETTTGDAAGETSSDGNIAGTTTQGGYAQGDTNYSDAGFVSGTQNVSPGTVTNNYDTTSSSSGSIVIVTNKTDPSVTVTTTTTSSSSSGGFIDGVKIEEGSNFIDDSSNIVSNGFISTVTTTSQVVSTNSNAFINQGSISAPKMPDGNVVTMTALSKEGLGSGAASFYTISSAEELLLFREYINLNKGKNESFILTSDIDMSGIEWDESIDVFKGTFYGNAHSIIGLTGTQGLFNHNYGEIYDLGIIDADIGSNSDEEHAVLVDYNTGVVYNCFTTGNLYSGHNTYQGGLVGYNCAGGEVRYSYSTVVLDSIIPIYAGGLVGGNGGDILDCYTEAAYGGYMEDGSYYGGLVGIQEGGRISDSYSRTNMIYADDPSPGIDNNNIDGTCGGLIGYYGSGRIESSYADSMSFIGTISQAAATDLTDNVYDCYVSGAYSFGEVEDLNGNDGSGYSGSLTTNVALDTIVWSDLAWGYMNEDGTFGNVTATTATMSSGIELSAVRSGTLSEDVYYISSAQDLVKLSELVADGADTTGKTFILKNDIDMTGIEFESIKSFDGKFYGNGHTISNLSIEEHGLFTELGINASVQDLGIENINIMGSNYTATGGLADESYAIINNCWVTGSISDDEGLNVGGLIGRVNAGSVSNSYADVDISTTSDTDLIGGLIGSVDASVILFEITNSYSTGNIDTNDVGMYVGGLVGNDEGSFTKLKNVYATGNINGYDCIGGLVGYGSNTIIEQAYYSGECSGGGDVDAIGNNIYDTTNVYYNSSNVSSSYGTWLSFSQMQTATTVQGCGFTAENGWNTVDGATPTLGNQGGRISISSIEDDYYNFESGKIYTISTKEDLIQLANLIYNYSSTTNGAIFVLENDIDFEGEDFAGIAQFDGIFNGNGHVISNVNILDSESLDTYTGIFQQLGSTAVVENLGIENATTVVTSGNYYSNYFGVLAGYMEGGATINNCYATGSMNIDANSGSSQECIGGLVGYMDTENGEITTINNSYADVDIQINAGYANAVGGLVGRIYNQFDAVLTNSYATGDVTGASYNLGGLVGLIESDHSNGDVTIKNVYSTGAVTSTGGGSGDYAGGLIGQAHLGGSSNIIKNAYTTASVANNAYLTYGGLWGYMYYGSSETTIIENVYCLDTGIQSNCTPDADQNQYKITESELYDAATMQSKGFTAANGWACVDGSAPKLGGGGGQVNITEAIAAGGALSSDKMYVISTADDLVALADYVNNGGNTDGITFVLTDDLDMNGVSFSSIGTGTIFKGKFYGNGHTISNLTKSLFDCTAGATIKDLGLENCNITDSYYCGALINVNGADSTLVTQTTIIDNVYATGSISFVQNNAYYNVGGLVGDSSGSHASLYIKNSWVDMDLDISDPTSTALGVGGLIGSSGNEEGTFIENSYSTGTISGAGCTVGGLVGNASLGISIKQSYSVMDIDASATAGGIIGCNDCSDWDDNSLDTVYYGGTITASSYYNVGGVIGLINNIPSATNVVYKYNSEYGAYSTNSDYSVSATALTEAQMTDGTTMKSHGFTSVDNGGVWMYEANSLPTFGNVLSSETTTETTTEVKQLTITEALAEVGSLSSGNTYGISTVADLNKLAELVNGGLDTTGMTFVLTQDINMSSVADFAGIGTGSSEFKGVFEGNGYKIQNLKMENTSTTGLFNYTSGATIKNVGLTDVNIKGGAQTGALVGNADATTISNAYSTGTVTGDSSAYVGGLVGFLDGTTSKIENSFSTATVDGEDNIGGLVGSNNTGTITKSYATGNVTATNMWAGGLVGYNSGTITMAYAIGDVNSVEGEGGGLIGENDGGTISTVYAAGTVTGSDSGALVGVRRDGIFTNAVCNSTGHTSAVGSGSSQGIRGLALNVMADGSSMKSYGFSDTSIWTYSAGTLPTLNNNSVQLQSSSSTVVKTVTEAIAEGGLVAGNTYAVSSADDLVALATFSASNSTAGIKFAMTGDIDMSSVDNFAGIQSFAGEFYGNGNEIHNLTISATAGSAGLFRILTGNAIVRDVGLVDVDISSTSNYVGALVGSTTSGSNIEVANCYVVGGTVKGGHQTGGLIGDMKGTLTESYADVTVIGNADCYNIGGLIGDLNGGTATQCFAAGDVTGHQQVGGFAGATENSASIANCYASGDVTGSSDSANRLGGFIGYMTSGTINTAYSTGNVMTGTIIGGFLGQRKTGTTVTNGVYNSSTGLSKVGSGSSTGISGLTMEQMVTQSEMEAKGFTSIDDGGVWEYNAVDGQKPPSFGIGDVLCPAGKVYVSDVADPGFQTFVKGDTYYIGTENDLNCLIYMVNHYGADTTDVSFVLENDIVMTSAITEGIGAYPYAFNGNFYGNGHTISNLEISGSDEVALFAYTEGALIKDVGIVNAKVTSADDYAAVLVANAYDTTIENCYATGTVDGGGDYTGGLVGLMDSGYITNSYAEVDVVGAGDYVGGLVGYMYDTTLESCYATGNITNNNSSAGGLIGSMEDSSVWKCYATGNVDGYSDAGGFVGSIFGASDLEHCYSTGAVTWGDSGGGFAGCAYGDDITVYGGCVYNTGSGDVVLNTDSDERFVGLAIEDMRNQSIMEGYGFTEGEGWEYITGATPTLGNVSVTGGGKVYVSTLTDFKVGDTYFISTEADLQKLAELVNAGKKTAGVTFVMENDIALTEEFTPIGYANGHAFSGDFYGNGHTISGLVIDKDSQYAGLFGLVHNGKIQDLGIINANVKGANFTGILAGSISQNSEIYNCYVSGTVTGGIRTGGLVGAMISGTITDSYSSATVSGSSQVGGLVGGIQNSDIRRSYASGDVAATGVYSGGFVGYISGGQVEDSYATGEIISTSSSVGGFVGYMTGSTASIQSSYSTGRAYGTTNIGGFVGRYGDGTIENAVYNSSTGLSAAGTGTPTGVTGLTLTEMSNQATMEAQGFTSVDDGGCWKYITNATPSLGDATVVDAGKVYVSDVDKFRAGNTYYIQSDADLRHLSDLVNGGEDTYGVTFILDQDITMSDDVFTSIGSSTNKFEGNFYGNGHTIDNLTIDSSNDYVGLFGYTKDSTIQDVGLTNVDITGANYVGALVGYVSGGEIKNSYVLGGTVSGTDDVGGLVGFSYTTIRDSYSTVDVSGVSMVGGLAGYANCTIIGSYATGNVSASGDYAGGLVGSSLVLTIRDSYATGDVSGSNVGGLVGRVAASLEFTQAYSSGKVSGTNAGGVIGQLATNNYSFTSVVYNKGSGDVVVNASGVGEYGSGVTEVTTITGAYIEDMRDKTYMEAQGFTEADGWIYVDYTTPTRGNVNVTGGGKVYVSTLTDFKVGDTYFISTEADLQKLAELVNAGKKTAGVTFVMENDIALTEEFTPIGYANGHAFSGDFYGNGHTISGLVIDKDSQYAGLFGLVHNGKIQDLGIINANVKGANFTGILAGSISQNSEIYNCYVSGTVTGGIRTGGLVGAMISGTITDSYSSATVSGSSQVGGLVGGIQNSDIRRSYASGDVAATGVYSGGFVGYISGGQVEDSYATGEIISTSSSVGGFVGYMTGSTASIQSSYSTGRAYGTTNIGGFVGRYGDGTIENAVYNSSTGLSAAGTGTPTGITGLTLTQMSNQATMEAQGFTSVDDGGCWKYIANATPTLGDATVVAGGDKIYVSNADVTEFLAGNTYYIASADDITKIAALVNAGAETSGSTFILDGDVDMSGVDFESIGTASNAFEGDFYGNGNVIKNLTGDSGLFGYVNNSTIQDIGIENANITATDSNVGILVDNATSVSITNCYTTGSINGTTNVGAIAGYATGGTITDSYSSANVTGTTNVGGLVGYILDNNITNSYATGNVTASDNTAGGLVGAIYTGVITSSFATGNVSATNGKVGGLVGYLDGEVTNSYSTGRITGSTALGGIAGESNDATLSGNVYNASTGVTTSIGTGSATDDTVGLSIIQMADRAIMESKGFTADKGWVYYTNTTPQLSENVDVTDGGKVYVNSVDRFVAGETYYISTVDDMKRLAELVNNGDNTENVTFVLENDIDMSSVSDFDGIGISGNSFKGDFYGNGNVISGLNMTGTTNATGLFNRISNATIRDLGVVDATVSGTDYVGVLVGIVGENSVVENCYVTGTVNATGIYVGGLAGHVNGSGLVMQSYSSANVTSTGAEFTGGLVGLLYGTVKNCYADGTVTGKTRVGGLIGCTMNSTAVVESSYASATVAGNSMVGGLIGRCDDAKITNCYANSTVSGSSQVGTLIGNFQTRTVLSGNYATGSQAIGTNNASSGFALLTQEQLEDQSLMESYGFTTDKGWVYYENQAPKLRGQSGINSQNSAVTLETVFEDMADSTVAKDLYVTVNGTTYSNVFNGNETVGDALNWLNTISDINASFDEATSTFTVTSDYEDLLLQGGVANLLFGGNANVEYEEITVNTDSNYLQEEADGSKIWAGTKIKDLVAGSEYTIGYKDEAGNIVMQSFDGEQSLGDVFYWLLSKGIVSSVNDGVYTATKEGGSPTDIYGTIGTSLKGRNGTTVVEGSNYVSSESLTSESSSNATGTTKLKDMGIESGTIHVVDGDGNILDTVTIDNEMTINEVSTLLATKGVAMSISGGKVTATTDSTNRIIDGSSNMVSAMKLSNWQETEGKLTGTSTIAQMGFSDGAKLGVSLNGVSYTLSFDADDTLNDVISQLSTLDITASVDANGKFSATADAILRFSNELGSYLTQNSVLGYEKIADGYVSEENFEYSSASQTLTKNTTIGTLLGNDVGGTLRVTIDGNNVYDLQYSANDTVNDIIADLAGLGITADVNGGVFTAISVSNTFTFADNVGKAISGNTPQYTELTTGYISDDLSYELEDTATLDSTLKELGISSGNIHILDSSGNILQTVAVDESYSLNQVKSMLSSNGLDLSIDGDGVVTVASDKGYKIGDGTSNMVSKLGLDTWTKSSETLTEDTTIAEMGFSNGADLNLFLDGTTMNVLSFDGEETLQDVMFALSAYGIDCSIDADGKFTATSKEHTFVMSSTLGSYLTKGTTGYVNDSTGYETYKPLVEEKPLVGAVSEELDYQEKMTMDSTLESLGYQDGGNVRVLLDNGTVYNLSFLGSNKISDVVYALSAYGIDADVVDAKFKAESIDNTFTISGNFGSYLVSGGTYQTEVTGYESVAHTYETEKDVDYNTKLSDLGVAKGNLNVIKEGQLQGTAITITDNTTVRQLFNAIQPYGLTGDIKTDAAGNKYIEIQGNNTYLADGTSNVVSGLGMISVRQGDFNGNVTYWNDDADAGLVTEDMLITNFDRDGFTGVGSLIFETGSGDDAVEHIVNITTTDTVGSLITKLNAQGLDASLDKGRITISSGLDGISFKGGTSGIVRTMGLDIEDVDTYCESSSAITYDGETSYSAANFADANTKLDIVNVTQGTLSVFVDGVKCTIDVNPNESFKDLFTKITDAVAARTGQTIKVGFLDKNGNILTGATSVGNANNTGVIAMSIDEGHELVIGASNDTTNFATIANLNKTEWHEVVGSRALYKVNINSKITESGLFRDGQITEGTFTIGDAEFTIDANTTLKSLMEQINKSEKSYATAYWDTLSGTMVIQSTLTGASLINIEAGTSNFTDIMGFTVEKSGTSALVTSSQKLGQNAVVRINGTMVTASSNVITSDVSKIKGLTINLRNVSEGETVTITVEQNKEGIYEAVADTLDAYNAMMEALDKELTDKSTLGNESILKLMRNNLKRLMTSSLGGSYVFRNLSAIGISTGEASDDISKNVTSLLIDKDKFLEALSGDSDAVQNLLVGTTATPGIFLQANNIVENAISASGYFSNMADTLTRNISKLNEKIMKTNLSIEDYKSKLERRFHNMELTISGLQSSYSNFLNL